METGRLVSPLCNRCVMSTTAATPTRPATDLESTPNQNFQEDLYAYNVLNNKDGRTDTPHQLHT